MRNEPMRRNELPETCFSILPSSGQLIIINADYQITARVRVGNAEFAIGECEKAPDPFVTWVRNCKNDRDGPPNYFWGHYRSYRTAAVEDFCERANSHAGRESRLSAEPCREKNSGAAHCTSTVRQWRHNDHSAERQFGGIGQGRSCPKERTGHDQGHAHHACSTN